MRSKKDMIFWLLLYRMLVGEQRSLTRPLRVKSAQMYVKTVQAARRSVFVLMGFCLLCIFLFGGFLLFHVGLFFYMDGDLSDKGGIFMWLGGIYFLLTLVICALALSQRRWMSMSGADVAVRKAIK